jgi:hypothetical protein
MFPSYGSYCSANRADFLAQAPPGANQGVITYSINPECRSQLFYSGRSNRLLRVCTHQSVLRLRYVSINGTVPGGKVWYRDRGIAG